MPMVRKFLPHACQTNCCTLLNPFVNPLNQYLEYLLVGARFKL